MAEKLRPFHLAIPVSNLNLAKKWYGTILGCSLGRQTVEWIDFNFFGHQLVVHLAPTKEEKVFNNRMNGKKVPSRHFGVILTAEEWKKLATRLKKKNLKFIIQPQTRFSGQTGEQSTFFIEDPFGNALEFKAFRNDDQIFAV